MDYQPLNERSCIITDLERTRDKGCKIYEVGTGADERDQNLPLNSSKKKQKSFLNKQPYPICTQHADEWGTA